MIVASGVSASAQSIVRVDVANDGSESTGKVSTLDVSADGTKVVFATDADGLDPADVNGLRDVLLHDLVAGTTKLVSTHSNGTVGDRWSRNPRISADGRFVAFDSAATDLVDLDLNDVPDVFLCDLAIPGTTRVSLATDGSEADGESSLVAISRDGGRVLFTSFATNLVANDLNGVADLFLRDVVAGTTTRVSVAADGTEADADSLGGDLSSDGNVVLITSWASNLVANDLNGVLDAFVHDLVAGTVVRASVANDGSELINGAFNMYEPGAALSPDGRLVAFSTYDAIDPADEIYSDVYLRDLAAGTTTILSVDSNGQPGSSRDFYGGSVARAISGDARNVLFEGDATDLAEGGGTSPSQRDVYVRDRELAMTLREDNDPDGTAGDGWSGGARMTPDASRIVFVSTAPELIEGKQEFGRCAYVVTRSLRAAAAHDYGAGLAGTFGVPTLGVAEPLRLHQPYDIDLGNSLGNWTLALLLIGTEEAQLKTSFGGDMLLLPAWTQLVVVAPAGFDFTGTVPPDERLASTTMRLQALEIDAGAPRGVSFTAGLAIEVGF